MAYLSLDCCPLWCHGRRFCLPYKQDGHITFSHFANLRGKIPSCAAHRMISNGACPILMCQLINRASSCGLIGVSNSCYVGCRNAGGSTLNPTRRGFVARLSSARSPSSEVPGGASSLGNHLLLRHRRQELALGLVGAKNLRQRSKRIGRCLDL